MAWYDEVAFYHIYPLGLSGAPKQNEYKEPVHRLRDMKVWIDHIKEMGFGAIYIGPLFESVGHGYETTDYKKLDSRLGDNEDLKDFVATCHAKGLRVIFDGVFNHTGRDFFAFKDIQQNRENSRYRDWYCNVNFWGNTEYNDGFSYENWGGYNLLVKLNQRNPEVQQYIADVIRFWVAEFDVDGIRLDAADVLDFEFMRVLRQVANEVKPDFWLMGEVIHGDYNRWANDSTLHSVTNYHLHKALYSGHNDHNYFEIAHTVKRLNDMGNLHLYNFSDNHDVERIYTKLHNKKHYTPVHILVYTLPGVPSIYYGSEFGIEGKKERWSDDSLRPQLHIEDYKNALENNECTALIAKLGKIRKEQMALSYGDYRELLLTNRQYAFSRNYNGTSVVITVNNDDSDYVMTVRAGESPFYYGLLSGQKVEVVNGNICVNVKANNGDIWVPYAGQDVVKDETGEQTKAGILVAAVEQEAIADETIMPGAEAETVTDAERSVAEEYESQAVVAVIDEAGETISSLKVIPEEQFEEEEESEIASEEQIVEEISAAEVEEEVSKAEAPECEAVAGEDTGKTADELANGVLEQIKAAQEKAFEEGRIAGLQEAILARMEKNGYVTDQMRNDVYNQTHIQSLINWIKSF